MPAAPIARQHASTESSRLPRKEKLGFLAKALLQRNARVEQVVGKLKHFKRNPLHCEEETNFGPIIAFAAGFALV